MKEKNSEGRPSAAVEDMELLQKAFCCILYPYDIQFLCVCGLQDAAAVWSGEIIFNGRMP